MMYIKVVSKEYSISEARAHLPSLVDQAEAGSKIKLTRRGKPVAVVLPIREYERLRGDGPTFARAYRLFLEAYSLEDVALDADFASAVRDKGAGRKVSL